MFIFNSKIYVSERCQQHSCVVVLAKVSKKNRYYRIIVKYRYLRSDDYHHHSLVLRVDRFFSGANNANSSNPLVLKVDNVRFCRGAVTKNSGENLHEYMYIDNYQQS